MAKQLKIVAIVATAVLGLGAALFFAQPKTSSNNSNQVGHDNMDMGSSATEAGVLAADKTFFDFGTISMKDGKVSTIFKLKNLKIEPVALTRLYTSCMCTVASIKITDKTEGPFGMLGHGSIPKFKDWLPSSEQAEVLVTFDPNAHGPTGVGTIERVVTVEGENGKLAELQIKATVTP